MINYREGVTTMNELRYIDYHNAEGQLTHKKIFTATGQFVRMEEYDPQTGQFIRVVDHPLEKVALYRVSTVRFFV